MKGKGFLKVCGILMIIGGAISIIVGIISLIGGIALAAAMGAIGALVIIAALLALIGGVIELITGILGVKNCDKPEKATACIVWGIIVFVIQLISLILSAVSSNAGALSIIVSIIFGLALPVLYLIGAYLNKKAA